ncbi:hypothetical protein [uncultured Polaribacter sp.]|uniref:hypothetical protein n=1 Tax=uncultured Polaribacter sp. TaxID=174711 RepID=UPI002618DA4B|nr:hypothetical protein [uncultured Polaribacter sp.]
MLQFVEKELIGVLGNRPIFNVLKADTGALPFKINHRTLLIGDNKEWPVFLVKDALKAMYQFVLHEPAFNFKKLDFVGNTNLTDKEILQYIVFNHDDDGHFIFDDFTEADTTVLKNLCKSNLMNTPYSERNLLDFYDWLHINIGAFVWFNYAQITEFVTFSSYDFFTENYLEKPLKNRYDNIHNSPENINSIQELFQEKERNVNYQNLKTLEDKTLISDLVAGNTWTLDNVYWYFKNNR